jgi:hypothetical protein
MWSSLSPNPHSTPSATSVHFAATSVHFAATNVHFAVASVHFAVASVHFAATNVHFAVASVHFAATNVHFAATNVHFAVATNVHFAATSAEKDRLLVSVEVEGTIMPSFCWVYEENRVRIDGENVQRITGQRFAFAGRSYQASTADRVVRFLAADVVARVWSFVINILKETAAAAQHK